MNKRIYLSSPTMHGEEMEFIKEAFDTNWVAPLGKNVDEFEKECASLAGVSSAAALSAGTAALHLAYKLSGVKEGSVVLVSDLTFSATVNPVLYEKGVPVFIDSERDTWNMDPEALEKALKKYPEAAAVGLVNLYGTPAKLKDIVWLCEKYGVPLIEDAAESMGATYHGKMTGSFGKFGIFSFNGNKIITSSGGGMLLSDDDELIKRARFFATQSRDPAPHYQHSEIGYNYRMSNVVAGIGRGQLIHLKEHIAKKKEIYEAYKSAFRDIDGISLNPYEKDTEPNFWLSCLYVDPKLNINTYDIMDALGKENIESRPIWKPMHMQPIFEKNDFVSVSENSVSEDIFKNGLCLPSDIKNTKEDMDKIISIVRSFFK